MRKYLYWIIVFIGLLQIFGYLLGNKTIKGLGMATASSPLPIVFTEVKGIETFTSDFYIEFLDENSNLQKVQITPEMYSKLKGPYNRRNIYGAAISYGPVLDKKLLNPVLEYAICDKVLLREIGLPINGSDYKIKIETKTSGKNDTWTLIPICKN